MDTLYHIALGFGLLLLLWFLISVGPSVIIAGVISAFILYLREVTQIQTKLYDSDIRKGWDFRFWSKSKNLETWVPIVFTITVGVLLQMIS